MGWDSTDGIAWSDAASVEGRDCADLLDAGSGGLDWLRKAIHRYHEAVDGGLLSPLWIDGHSFPDDASVDALYYAENDINTGLLHAKADDLTHAVSAADALLASQTAAVRALPDAWRDSPAADAAHERLRAFTNHAARQVAAVAALRDHLPAAATAVHGFVKTKAAFVQGFDCASDGRLCVAGLSLRPAGPAPGDDPVSWAISGALRNLGGNRSALDAAARTYDKIRGQFPNLPERPSDSVVTDDMFDAAESICKQWVQQHFGPAVRTAVGEFVNQCAICERGVGGVYETVKQVFDEIKPDRFPQPGFAGPAVEFAPAALGGGLGLPVADGAALAELGEQVVAPLIADADQIARQAGHWAESGPVAPDAQAPHDGSPVGTAPGPAAPHSHEPPQAHPPQDHSGPAQPGQTQPAQGPQATHPPEHAPARDAGAGRLSEHHFPPAAPAPAGPGRAVGGTPLAGAEADEVAAVPVHPLLSSLSRMAAQPPKTPAPTPPDTGKTGSEPAPSTGARLGNSEPL